MNPFFLLFCLVFGGSVLAGSARIVNEKNEALVERLGSFNKKLGPGLNLIIPVLDRIVYQGTTREKVIDIPPQSCITKDNVAITVDAVVYWQIVDMEKAYYKVENLQTAMVNLVLTQIRAEIGKLELDQTFTARTEINELLLRELDISTDPWGVKVTRVELRDIMPSKAVQDSMELQMSAERKKRAAILSSEGERESAINSAQGQAQAKILEAEAMKKAAILKAEAERQQQILKAEATAAALEIVSEKLKSDPKAREALQFLLTRHYLEMGTAIGSSESSKVLFLDPRTMMGTIESIKAAIGEEKSSLAEDLAKIDRLS